MNGTESAKTETQRRNKRLWRILVRPFWRAVLRFFDRYARCKGWLNRWRGRPGRNACDGWISVERALARSRPRAPDWHGPPISF